MVQDAHSKVYSWRELGAWLVLLVALLAIISSTMTWGQHDAFVSSEVQFTDVSPTGMRIVPASCASSPSYPHGNLTPTVDASGFGYRSDTGQVEYGAYRNGIYVCVTNTTGSSFFIPADTAAEMNAVKSTGSSVPGLQIW